MHDRGDRGPIRAPHWWLTGPLIMGTNVHEFILCVHPYTATPRRRSRGELPGFPFVPDIEQRYVPDAVLVRPPPSLERSLAYLQPDDTCIGTTTDGQGILSTRCK